MGKTASVSGTLHPMAAFATVSGMTETIRINRLEDRLNPLIPFPHKHDFYQILLVTQGRGWHEIDFERIAIEKQRIFMMCPGQIHTWMLQPKCKGFILEFEAKTFQSKDVRWNQLGRIMHQSQASLLLDKGLFVKVLHLITTALEEYEEKQPGSELILHTSLTQLLVWLARQSSGHSPQHSTYELYEKFMLLVERHYSEQHRVEFYAKALKLSTKALTMRFYREHLHPPRELIQDRCILEAKRHLAYSDRSISEIADTLGFEDANYFSRFFRSKSQMTPGQFRESARR